MAVDIDLQALTQADLDQLWEDVDVERQRRLHETAIPATIEDLNQKYLNADANVWEPGVYGWTAVAV